jgi:hypothetical protein
MRITVSYYTRDTYDFPDAMWLEAMALCDNDADAAFDFLLEETSEIAHYLHKSDVTDRFIDVTEEEV